MHLTLRQLSYFVATAQTGSATRAAALLNVSQPSISAAIRDLEQILGQPLFLRRQAQGLELSRFGAQKLAKAREVLAAAEQFTSDDGVVHRLVIGYFSTLGPSWIPGIVRRLEGALPRLRIALLECDLEQMSRALERGVVDLALTYDIGLPGSVHRDALIDMQPYAIMAPDHPLATGDTVALADLARYPFALVDLPLSREFLMLPFWQQGLAPDVLLRTGSVEMVRSMVAEGGCVSLLFTRPSHDVTVEGKRVVCRALNDTSLHQRLVLAQTDAGMGDPLRAAAIAAIRDYFAEKEAATAPTDG